MDRPHLRDGQGRLAWCARWPRCHRAMTAFVYDTGELIAAEDNVRGIWTMHRRALERRAVPIVPAGVLTEAWRGAKHSPSLARFLAGVQVEPPHIAAAQSRTEDSLVSPLIVRRCHVARKHPE